MNGEVIKNIVMIVMVGYVSKAMPVLPKKIEELFEMPLFNMMFLSALLYLQSGNIVLSVSVSVALYAMMYLIKMAIRMPFEDFSDADMEEIKNNEMYSYLDDESKASDSVQGLMADIAEKASDVQNFYLERCNCKN